jgi:hypothetical protein
LGRCPWGSLSSITRHAATVHSAASSVVPARPGAVTVVPAGIAGGPGAEGGALATARGLSWRTGREEKALKFAKMIVTRAIKP